MFNPNRLRSLLLNIFLLPAFLLMLVNSGSSLAVEKTTDDNIWVYQQSTGKLFLGKQEIGKGYSGHGEGLNNPKLEDKRNVGPIPRGLWTIGKAADHKTKGPITMKLDPDGHKAHGRTDFLIHGDNDKANNSASEGCIILTKPLRQKIADSKISKLKVIQ